MSLFTKFLVSRVSGWIAVAAVTATLALGAVTTKIVWDYQALKADAAYCKGRESMLDIIKPLEERIVKEIEDRDGEVIEELENERDAETLDGEDINKGCAGQRAPESILKYHGLRE